MLTKEQKREQSEVLRETLSSATTLFLMENTGLNVNDINVLRSEVRKTDATYKVVKNTVTRLAVEGMHSRARWLGGCSTPLQLPGRWNGPCFSRR